MENKTEHKKVNTFHYNTKDLETMINNALANLKIQEFNFIGKDTTNDDVFNLLINNEKEELLKFFNRINHHLLIHYHLITKSTLPSKNKFQL